jgi:hypothetical protein
VRTSRSARAAAASASAGAALVARLAGGARRGAAGLRAPRSSRRSSPRRAGSRAHPRAWLLPARCSRSSARRARRLAGFGAPSSLAWERGPRCGRALRSSISCAPHCLAGSGSAGGLLAGPGRGRWLRPARRLAVATRRRRSALPRCTGANYLLIRRPCGAEGSRRLRDSRSQHRSKGARPEPVCGQVASGCRLLRAPGDASRLGGARMRAALRARARSRRARPASGGRPRPAEIHGEALAGVTVLDGSLRVSGERQRATSSVLGGDAGSPPGARVDGDVHVLGGEVETEPPARSSAGAPSPTRRSRAPG